MIRHKYLHTIIPKDLKYDGYDVTLSVIGLFNTETQQWRYYSCSLFINSGGVFMLSTDLHSISLPANISNVEFAKEFKSAELALSYINEFRDKWESGSNEPKQVIRDNKINDILKNK